MPRTRSDAGTSHARALPLASSPSPGFDGADMVAVP